MTTIAYNHKDQEIAVDSRLTRGSMISSDKGIKVIKKDGVAFVLAGLTESYPKLIDMWFSGEADKSIECSAFVISDGKVYDFGINEDGEISSELIDENLSKGSGETWAHAAMDFGCSAKDAVKYAMTRDIYTGGKIKVIKVN